VVDFRLRKQRDFDRVYREGKKVVGRRFVLYLLEARGAGTRAAFVASRKVGGAVHRNRAKRLLRESFRSVRPGLRRDDLWFVWIARAAIAGCSFHDVHAEMDAVLAAEGLLGER
jgi:ribonuclease P protein component